ncbi:MAG: hypothetical protein ICV62_05955 [Cyanobacteria bacterium Co-bin13]|nr:hypothetical protein [Cyanobacteria bacterium Co-bin13]
MKIRQIGWAALAMVALLGALLLGNGAGLLQRWGMPAVQAQLSAPTSAPAPAAPAAPAAPLPLGGTFTDPQSRFEIGLLETMTVSSAGGSPLFQRPDGSLAYTVVVVPLSPGSADPLPDVALVRAAEEAFGSGEGFQTTGFQAVNGGGLQIGWRGRLSQGSAPPAPVTGTILAKQQGENVFLLTVAATEAGAVQVGDAIATLAPTLKAL